jgi:HEPN domain-containing protein/predicted nucleotidyltransferase
LLRDHLWELAGKTLEACSQVYGARLVSFAVFGSLGRGTPSPNSDLDILLVVTKLPAGRLARMNEFGKVELMVAEELEDLHRLGIWASLSPILKTPAEVRIGSLLFLDMVTDAVVLFDQDGFLTRYLEDLAARLSALGAKKVRTGERWHWALPNGLSFTSFWPMTHTSQALSYLQKAEVRLKALELFFRAGAYSDCVREAQECVELALKGVLRHIGVEPPKQHDVGYLVVEYRDRLPASVAAQAQELARISKWLRKEREFAFYGEVDSIPTEEYSSEDAERAIADAVCVVQAVRTTIAASSTADPGANR